MSLLLAALALSAGLLGVGLARAERQLLAPSTEQPARVAPGSTLSLLVEVASALTPPPGIQEERAHRAFAVTLCSEGTPFGAPARSCFPLAVRNVRPLDGHSLHYRIEAPVPSWVAPSRYDLVVRFPGGEAQLQAAVLVARTELELVPASVLTIDASGAELPPVREPTRVRLHVGPAGLALHGATYETFPLPDATGLRLGFVALMDLRPGQRVRLSPAPRGPLPPLSISTRVGSTAAEVALDARSAPPGARLFWWLGPDLGAQGSTTRVRFAVREAARVQLLAITQQGAVQLTERLIPLRARRAFGCGLLPGQDAGWGDPGLGILVTGLLAVAGSRKLGRASHRARVQARSSGRRRGHEARE